MLFKCPIEKRVCVFAAGTMRSDSLTISWDELPDSWRTSSAVFNELDLRNDDVVLQDGAAAHADCAASCLVDIYVWAPTSLAHPWTHDAGRSTK